MNKREAARIRKERLAQIDRIVAQLQQQIDRAVALTGDYDEGENQEAQLYRERDRQLRAAQQEYERNIAAPPRRRAVKRELSTSRFWRHFGEDGRPVPPWEIEVGTAAADYDEEDDEHDMFADEGYSYEDFDSDWGGYEYSDTG